MSPISTEFTHPISTPESHTDGARCEKKRPGRKPNPASPALRKAQNRAAQRAFRERKERHIAELELERKRLTEQRDCLLTENEELRSRVEVLGHESWHLKGALLTLQLTCLIHQIAIPVHSPYIRKEALSKLEQRFPEIVSSYREIQENHNPLPTMDPQTPVSGATRSSRNECRASTHTIVVAKDGIHALSTGESSNHASSVAVALQSCVSAPAQGIRFSSKGSVGEERTVALKPSKVGESTAAVTRSLDVEATQTPKETRTEQANREAPASPHFSPEPIMLTKEPFPVYNLQAFQTLRLRSQLTKCIEMGSSAFVLEPTVLQTAIPHDARIDLIPVSPMRDRMILFRAMFDLDECLKCFLERAVYHGGDPTLPSSWSLPAEFYERFWFLCVDYSQPTIRKRWPALASSPCSSPTSSLPAIMMPEVPSKHPLPLSDLASLLTQEHDLPASHSFSNLYDFDMCDTDVSVSHQRHPSLTFSSTHSNYSYSDNDDAGSLVLSPKDDKHMQWEKDMGINNTLDTLMDELYATT